MPATYLDPSAPVKLAVVEPESQAPRRYLRTRRPLVSSAPARTEALRALLLEGERGLERGRAVLQRVELFGVNDQILATAGTLPPAGLRPLDAIHLATPRHLGRDTGPIVAYDTRILDAAGCWG